MHKSASSPAPMPWLRRARPLLGTLVEVGVRRAGALVARVEGAVAVADDAAYAAAFDAAFDAILQVQSQLSRFEHDSDIAQFNRAAAGACIQLRHHTAAVLQAAQCLHQASGGAFDISLGTGPQAWRLDGALLHKLSDTVRLDAGGIAKGHAVDAAVSALQASGCAAGWVNAGGDLRAFGDVGVPIHLRDEASGGVRPFGLLRDGAFATSHFGTGARAQLAGAAPASCHAKNASKPPPPRQFSVAAPLALWADALTKVVALHGTSHLAILDHFEAQAWAH